MNLLKRCSLSRPYYNKVRLRRGERIIDNILGNNGKVNSLSSVEFLNAENKGMKVFLLINRKMAHFVAYLYFSSSAENNFFLKLSERKNQKRQQLYTESPEKIQKSCLPPEFTASMHYSFSFKHVVHSYFSLN